MGTTLAGLGRVDESTTCYRESLDIAREISDLWGECWNLYCLSDILRSEGQIAEALTNVERSLSVARKMGNQGTIAEILTGKGQILAQLERISEAKQALEQATAMLTEMDQTVGLGYAYCSWTHYHLAVATQSPTGSQLPDESVLAARYSLAKAEMYARIAGVSDASELCTFIEDARAAIEEYEQEQGAQQACV